MAVALNVALAGTQAVFASRAGSLSLLADAAHNAADVLGLVLAWGAARLALRPPTERHTYGLRSASILAALANALLLLVGVGGVAWEAIQRLARPAAVEGSTVAIVAAVSVVVNAASAALLAAGSRRDLNLRAATMHLVADGAVSLGVAVVGVVLLFRPWWWLDPATSLAISAAIVAAAWRLLRDTLDLALAGVPQGIDLRAVERYLASVPGVVEVHDLHIWPTSTSETALTAHLVMPQSRSSDALLAEIDRDLHDRFRIEHATVQVEERGLDRCCPIPRGTAARS